MFLLLDSEGAAVKEATAYFLGSKEVPEQERKYMRGLTDVELTTVMMGNAKIQATGLGKLVAKKQGGSKKQKDKTKDSGSGGTKKDNKSKKQGSKKK